MHSSTSRDSLLNRLPALINGPAMRQLDRLEPRHAGVGL
jgi:hypothetical protein